MDYHYHGRRLEALNIDTDIRAQTDAVISISTIPISIPFTSHHISYRLQTQVDQGFVVW